MNDRETFLARWSRRKHAAERADARLPATPAPAAFEEPLEGSAGETAGAGIPSEHPVTSGAGSDGAIIPPFDLGTLPPIESIAADTDIRAFLAPGVPPELTRAALRRAWAADPTIRDFVGLADYDWDFNAPGSMAGFGPLEMTEELRRIAARIIGPVTEASHVAESAEPAGHLKSDSETAPADVVRDTTAQGAARIPSPACDRPMIAEQKPPDEAEKSQTVVQPRHGGALPK
jgi:Protein of unknown function (DUF3306)